jgi:hypothetical protein
METGVEECFLFDSARVSPGTPISSWSNTGEIIVRDACSGVELKR